MKFEMNKVQLFIIVFVVILTALIMNFNKLKENSKNVEQDKTDDLTVTNEIDTSEESFNIDDYYRTGLKGETVENGATIKPSKTIELTFASQEELDYYASGYEENDEVFNFYSGTTCLGDAVGTGLHSEYKASSTYKTQDNKYDVSNLESLVYDSCWVEGVEGDGIGETIEISTFDTSEKVEWANDGETINRRYDSIDDVKDYLLTTYNNSGDTFGKEYPISEDNLSEYHNYIDKIAIINGYAKDDNLWKNNNRVKKLKVIIDDNLECYLDLADTKDLQLFDINYENENITKKINLKFEIEEIYPGEKYNDTCLTSLYLVGGSNVKWGGR